MERMRKLLHLDIGRLLNFAIKGLPMNNISSFSNNYRWAIRHLVRMGMHLLPTKEDMIDMILKTAPPSKNYKESSDYREYDSIIKDFIQVLNHVYGLVHKIYDKNNFLELVFV